MVKRFELEEIVRDARSRTGVPGVAAAMLSDGNVTSVADGVLELGRDDRVAVETPFRVASISKPFTASLAVSTLELDDRLAALLSHTAGLCPESATPLPESAQGLFSYSNAGYWAAGELAASAAATSFDDAMAKRILRPLGLSSSGYEEPAAPARGHVQEGESGHRALPADAYPVRRRPSGGLWSTVGDLLRFAAHHLGGTGPLSGEQRALMHTPRSDALGAGYGLGFWVRDAGGRAAVDHEGSIAGYQSYLLLVPEDAFALAVLTNSWRGSGLVRRVVEQLGLAPRPLAPGPGAADMERERLSTSAPPVASDFRGLRPGVRPPGVAGRYVLENAEAVVAESGDGGFAIEDVETDPVTGARTSKRFPVQPIGAGVFGFARGVLIGHRLDFPRPGLARIGWVVMPRVDE
jgi:CubicO group peptidase (beta-lactamase class C family)